MIEMAGKELELALQTQLSEVQPRASMRAQPIGLPVERAAITFPCVLRVLIYVRQGEIIHVPGPQFLIGRGADCDLALPCCFVSRHHCKLVWGEGAGRVIIRDLGSRNGTFVNSQRIQTEKGLSDGDEINVGPWLFGVSVDPAGLPSQQIPLAPASQTDAEKEWIICVGRNRRVFGFRIADRICHTFHGNTSGMRR